MSGCALAARPQPPELKPATMVAGGLLYWALLQTAIMSGATLPFTDAAFEQLVVAMGLPLLALAAVALKQEGRRRQEIDALTGLGNRRALALKALRLLEGSAPGGLSLIIIDVDGLKALNDGCSHRVGDELLRCAAQHLSGLSADTFRVDGDEFAVLVDRASGDSVASVVRSLAPYDVELLTCGHKHTLQLSYGFATLREAESYEQLFGRAETRLRQFKSRPGNSRLGSRPASPMVEAEAPAAPESPEAGSDRVVSIFSRRPKGLTRS